MTAELIFAALKDMDAAEPAYREAHLQFEGRRPEVFSSDKIKALIGKTGDKLKIGFIHTVVNAVADRLTLAGLSASTPAAQEVLEEVWTENGMGLGFKDAMHIASEYGDSYIIVTTGEETAFRPSEVGIFVQKPQTMRVFYDPARPGVKTHAVQQWRENGHLRVNLYFPDRTEPWISVDAVDRNTIPQDFRRFDEDQVNEFGLPVFHFKAGASIDANYGTPEHIRGYNAQNSINKAVISLMGAMDSAGFPQRYGLQDTAAEEMVFDGPGVEGLPGVDVVNREAPSLLNSNLETIRRAGPGTMMLLEGLKSVGQFDAADLEKFAITTASLIRWMAAVTGTPLDHFEVTTAVSGAARREAQRPLISKVSDRKARYGVEADALLAYLLRCKGFVGVSAKANWSPTFIERDADSIAEAKARVDLGVPVDVALLEVGYTESEISLWPAVVQARQIRGAQ